MATTTKQCPFCAEQIHIDAKKCKHCGEILDDAMREQNKKEAAQRPPSPGVAAVLSFVIPGAGQMYRGMIFEGFIWLVFTVVGYALFIVPGIALHIYCIVKAYEPTKPKPKAVTAHAIPQKRRRLGIEKWQEYPALFMVGFIIAGGVLVCMNGGFDTPPQHPALVFSLLLAPSILLPLVWIFLRPHAVRRGWVADGR